MASERARAALRLRREGETYGDIAEHLGVSKVRARALTHAALREEARISGSHQPTQEAFDSIKQGSKKRLHDPVNAGVRLSREMLARIDGFAKLKKLKRSQALRLLIEDALARLTIAPPD